MNKFFGCSDAFKVTNERCMATCHNMPETHPPV